MCQQPLVWGAWMKQFLLFSPPPSVNEAEWEESLPPKPSQTAKTDYSGSVAMAGAELYSFIYIPHRKAVTNQLAEHCLTVS